MATGTKQKTASFTIYGRLDDLNKYTGKNRSNRYAGAKMKEANENIIKHAALSERDILQAKFSGKVHITYKWYEQNKRRDPDNIAFAKKFIQDALVDIGVLEGDGWRHIAGFTDEFYIDREKPRIEVVISEVENG